MVEILTLREKEIIKKKLNGLRLSQNESNILSKYVRPKLKEASKISADKLLNKLEYNQKGRSIEKKIKEIVLKFILDADAIIVCGSAIQTNYKEYNDLDVIIATKGLMDPKEKKQVMEKLEQAGRERNLKLDIQIYTKASILNQYPHNPSLIYQLQDSKVVYGKLTLPKKIELSGLDLRMKLDWSENLNRESSANEIYQALRNAMLVSLLMNKKVDNTQLTLSMMNLLGKDLLVKLKMNAADKKERKLVLTYLNLLTQHLERGLKEQKWGKIVIESL